MGKWQIGTIKGIPLYSHWTLPVMAIFVTALFYTKEDISPLYYLVYPIMMLGVLAHELGHAITAQALGGRCAKITLNGFGGIAEIHSMTKGDKNDAFTTAAGPLANLIFALIFFTPIAVAALIGAELDINSINILSVLFLGVVINATLVAFNLLPVYPMDGGRLLQIALSQMAGETNGNEVLLAITPIITITTLTLLASVGSLPGSMIVTAMGVAGMIMLKSELGR